MGMFRVWSEVLQPCTNGKALRAAGELCEAQCRPLGETPATGQITGEAAVR